MVQCIQPGAREVCGLVEESAAGAGAWLKEQETSRAGKVSRTLVVAGEALTPGPKPYKGLPVALSLVVDHEALQCLGSLSNLAEWGNLVSEHDSLPIGGVICREECGEQVLQVILGGRSPT